MKFNHFQEIVHRICEDVPCPRCEEDFEEIDIEVQGATDRSIEFFTECPHCGAQVCIAAHIETQIPLKKVSHKRNHKGVGISRDKVEEIASALQKFRGHDVRELF